MIKPLLLFMSPLLISTISWGSVGDTLPGVEVLRNQMQQLNACVGRYMKAVEIRTATTGGSTAHSVNFETDPSNACRLVVERSRSEVQPDGILIIKTYRTTTSGLSPGLEGQNLVFRAMVQQPNGGLTRYSRNMSPVEIVSWQAEYSRDAQTNLNLMAVPMYGTQVNLIAQIGMPISLAAG